VIEPETVKAILTGICPRLAIPGPGNNQLAPFLLTSFIKKVSLFLIDE
jgi:hypothetical protein